MHLLKFNTSSIQDGVLLVAGAGDGDTGGGLGAFDGGSFQMIDRVSTSGITVFENRLARLLRTPLNTGGGEILIYDERGITHYLRVDELCDAHYMAWDGKQLIVSSTGTNSLLWVTLGGEVTRRWRAPGDDDSWHLNDVCLVEDRLYSCAFGRFAHYREYKDHLSDSNGMVFEVDSGRNVVGGFCAPHSPRYFDGAWTVCDSLRNSIVQMDGAGQRKREVKLRSFTRGLAVADEYLVVGESVARNSDGGQATGSVAIVRRADFSFVTRWEVPFREVSEVVVAPRALLQGLSTGFRTNPLRIGESDQLQLFRNLGIEPRRIWAVCERLTPDQCQVQIDANAPVTLTAGKSKLIECTVHNFADAFLCSEAPYPVYLAYRWRRCEDPNAMAEVEGNRTRLPRTLSPGETIRFGLDVIAPTNEGDYQIIITLVQEHVTWFDSISASNACSAKVKIVGSGENTRP
jgi:Domain of unknown function (DUF4915)